MNPKIRHIKKKEVSDVGVPRRTIIQIRQLSNGWTLTIDCSERMACFEETYFFKFLEVEQFLHKWPQSAIDAKPPQGG